MIRSFRDAETESLFRRERSRKFANIERVALRKLRLLHIAKDLLDLAAPPANRLEALKGDRKAQHSIRINDQSRICFVWRDGHAYDVEIVDYH